MLLVVNANDAANGVLKLVQLALLAVIFIVLPLSALAALGEIWTHGSPLILFGIAAAVALFLDRLLRKRKHTILYGLFAVAAVASGIAHGLQLRHEWNDAAEVGSPRTLLWAEGYSEIAKHREPTRHVADLFSPEQREIYRRLTISVNHSRFSDEREYSRIPTTGGDRIVYGRYSISPGEALDEYAQGIKQGDGDWLAFTAACLSQSQCKGEGSQEQILGRIKGRFHIDLVASFTDYFKNADSVAGATYTTRGFTPACQADALCAEVMDRIGVDLDRWSPQT